MGAIKPDETSSSTTTTAAPLTSSSHHITKRLAQFDSQSSRATGGCGCGSAHCACGSSCRCSHRNHVKQLQREGAVQQQQQEWKQLEPLLLRRRRNAEYSTLETIDENSLSMLRKEYKLGLKEITLNPDEDPAEALMRHNAASIREALERASQEPLEISGDQLAGGEVASEQDYAPETAVPDTNASSSSGAEVDINATISKELAAAREEFQKLYTLVQSLQEQLYQAQQGLHLCQQAVTSSSSSSTTTSTTTTTTTTEAPPRSNAIPTQNLGTQVPKSEAYDEQKWESLLASKGYDTKHLAQVQQQQYALGEQLTKPEANNSTDFSYQELPPYKPDNKAKRASGNGTTSSTTSTTESPNVAHMLNSLAADGTDAKEQAVEATDESSSTMPTPYALRGKFVRRRSTNYSSHTISDSGLSAVGLRLPRQATSRSNAELSLLRARSTKLDQLIDVLHDLLRLQLRRERKLNGISYATTSASSAAPSNRLRRGRARRMRRKPKSTSLQSKTI